MKAENLQRAGLFFILVLVSVIFLWMVRSFLVTILLAAIFTSLAYPLYTRITRLLRGKKEISSLYHLASVVQKPISSLIKRFYIEIELYQGVIRPYY